MASKEKGTINSRSIRCCACEPTKNKRHKNRRQRHLCTPVLIYRSHYTWRKYQGVGSGSSVELGRWFPRTVGKQIVADKEKKLQPSVPNINPER